jgi:hypothetical protein
MTSLAAMTSFFLGQTAIFTIVFITLFGSGLLRERGKLLALPPAGVRSPVCVILRGFSAAGAMGGVPALGATKKELDTVLSGGRDSNSVPEESWQEQ